MSHFEAVKSLTPQLNFIRRNLIRILIFLTCNMFLFSKRVQAQEKCEIFFDEAPTSVQHHVENNNYTQTRILDDYNNYFLFREGKNLLQTLANLRTGATWFDMGSGRNVALVKGLQKNPQIRRGVGVSATRTEFALGDERVPGRLKQINGDYLENLVAQGRLKSQKGKVDLITEVFGPMTYSRQVTEIMQIYLDLLKTNGQLMMAFQIARGKQRSIFEPKEVYPYNSVSSERGLNEYGLLEWMKTIQGISIEFVEQKTEKEEGQFEHTIGVRITKLIDQVNVPRTIEVDKEIPTVPPMRIFAPVNSNNQN
jgi:hypothetical protein